MTISFTMQAGTAPLDPVTSTLTITKVEQNAPNPPRASNTATNSITVTAIPGAVFSIDGGKTWQATLATTSIDFTSFIGDVSTQLEAMGMGELFGLLVETMLLKITMPILSFCVMIVLVGRMIEIYIYCSIGAIPFATMTNREWGQMGNNYLRGLVALGLRGFFIMICLAI